MLAMIIYPDISIVLDMRFSLYADAHSNTAMAIVGAD